MSDDEAPELVRLAGIDVDAVTEAQVVKRIVARAGAGEGGFVVTANVDHLKQLSHHAGLVAAYQRATITLADGQPLVWASRLQGQPLPERVPGSSLLWTLSEAAADAGIAVGLVGGTDGSAQATHDKLTLRSPHLEVTVVAAPRISDVPTGAEVDHAADILATGHPRIVYLAFGCPKQELLAAKLSERFPEVWFLGVGASFEMAAGSVRRAPALVQRSGLEWAWRLAMEPRRLARRYLVEDLPFVPGLFWRALAERRRRRVAHRRRADSLS